MLRNIMARFGSGSMRVRTSMNEIVYTRGDVAEGTISITGGAVRQEALAILLHLLVEKPDGRLTKYGDYKVHSEFAVLPKEELSLPFAIDLPADGPFTTETDKIVIETSVVKLLAINQRDKQYIRILP